MIIKKIASYYLPFLLFLFITSCASQDTNTSRVIVGIDVDAETLNPLYAFNMTEGDVTELIFLSLIQHRWNETEGEIEDLPMLASSWKWSDDSSSVTFSLRDDVFWSDSVKATSKDVVFSFELYSDKTVESHLYGTFHNFYTDESNQIDPEKSFQITSDNELILHFPEGSNPNLFEMDFPIVPEHVLSKIKRQNIPTTSFNFNPVTNGAYKLKKWVRNQMIILEADRSSFLIHPNSPSEIVFKIIPDYTNRLNQLKKGEVDIIRDVKTEDVEDLISTGEIKIGSIKGREYDYIGWNNIDPGRYSTGAVVPNLLFGNSEIRKALSHAINRREILDNYLNEFGELATGPVSPIFKKAIDQTITPYEYDIEKSKSLLKAGGWDDKDGDGILEKDNQKFSFELHIPGGNPRRNFAAAIVKNNLKAVGINIEIVTEEMGVFIDNLFAKKYNAWMVGWFVPIPISLKPYWYSSLEETQLNFASYQNSNADKLMDLYTNSSNREYQYKILRKLHRLLHEEEPVTFLYWIDTIVAFRNKVKNIEINPLGDIQHSWNWKLLDQ